MEKRHESWRLIEDALKDDILFTRFILDVDELVVWCSVKATDQVSLEPADICKIITIDSEALIRRENMSRYQKCEQLLFLLVPDLRVRCRRGAKDFAPLCRRQANCVTPSARQRIPLVTTMIIFTSQFPRCNSMCNFMSGMILRSLAKLFVYLTTRLISISFGTETSRSFSTHHGAL